MSKQFDAIEHFLREIDLLKTVQRRTYINGGERIENSAEHSWQLAMACWSMARSFNLQLDEEKLLKLALIHDLGEIDAGDTFLYDENRSDTHKDELQGVKRLESLAGNGIEDLSALWQEQEYGDSREVKFLKVVDRLLPFLHNIASQGKTWRQLSVKKSQIIKAHAFIGEEFPELHTWMRAKLDLAVSKGWVENA